jgi:uncharacterized lipoprotein YbaY
MKSGFRLLPCGVLLLWFLAGCASIDVTSAGNPNRMLKGTIEVGIPLPAGTEVAVRLLAVPGLEAARPAAGDLPIAPTQSAAAAERVVATHGFTLKAPSKETLDFSFEYEADDAQLRRGVMLDVRISHNGKLRYRSVTSHMVTLSSAAFPQRVQVQAVR